MLTIPQVRDAIAAAITTIPGLRVSSGWPGQVNPPQAVVHRKQTDRNVEFDGGNQTTFVVSVYLPSTDLATAQSTMDALLAEDGNSVVALITADTSLGGVVNWCTIPMIDEEGLVDLLGVTYYSAAISVLVSHN
jgi:hypothetical protein